MKTWRRVSALVLALVLTLGLSACGGKTEGLSKFDAKAYVDGLLRENYYGELTEAYAELVGATEEEAQEVYEYGIELEVSYFINMYEIEYPEDELYDELADLYKEIYKHAKFEVLDAAEMEDGSFSVQVNVEPIDIVQLADTDWDKTITPFYEKYPMDVQNAMSQKEYEKMDREYADLVLELYRDKLDEIGNMTVQTTLVQVKPDEDGVYSIDEDDFRKLDDLIIDYTDRVGVSA